MPISSFGKKRMTLQWVSYRLLYYLGLGDWWYEPTERSSIINGFYFIWATISNVYAFLNIFNELIANIRTDLSEREKNDLVQFTFAHISIGGKIVSFYILRNRISFIFKRLLEDFRSTFHCIELDKACVRQFKRYSVALVGVSYTTLFAATIDSIITYFKSGLPIRTEVTFFPRASNSWLTKIFRFFIELHWWYIVTIMGIIDCLAVASLVYVSFRFKLIQLYFKDMRTKLMNSEKTMNSRELQREFRRDFIIGVRMHEHALWCARNVQSGLGSLYSIQVFETVALLVMCLVKIITTERNMVFLMANFVYISCLVVITSAYMMPGGDVTYEASLVSTAIFHSGWEFLSSDLELRALVVVALQQSQIPVFMTAFGILTLSYTNFITVLRSSYSFFAVMY